MEYTIQKLARLAGISTRTLRYYDEIDLLPPARVNSSGYRIYGAKEVDALQQILFYRELGLSLEQIRAALQTPDFDRLAALKEHRRQLLQRKHQLDLLIDTVEKTILAEEAKITMNDHDKFMGFKKELIEKNEKTYGAEIRQKYGNDKIDESNARLMNLSPREYEQMQATGDEILRLLEQAVARKASPEEEIGKEIALLHKKWLSYTWPSYSAQAHRGLAQMYTADERFRAYYDRHTDGCAEFLKRAVEKHMV